MNTSVIAGLCGLCLCAIGSVAFADDPKFEYGKSDDLKDVKAVQWKASAQAGLVLTFLMGATFLGTQISEYARIGFAPNDNAFATIFFCLTGLHGAHVFVGLTLLLFATVRAVGYARFRAHLGEVAMAVVVVEQTG